MNPQLKNFLITSLAVVVGIAIYNNVAAPLLASFTVAAPATTAKV